MRLVNNYSHEQFLLMLGNHSKLPFYIWKRVKKGSFPLQIARLWGIPILIYPLFSEVNYETFKNF